MNKQRYEAAKNWITKNKFRYTLFIIVYKWLAAGIFALYTLMLLYLTFSGSKKVLLYLLVPGFMFVTLSAARKLIDRPRPYDVYNIVPIVAKDKKGQSFPSRHAASAAAVACAVMYINIPVGIAAMAAALLISASRVVGGVHFIKDVVCGFCYALLCSCVFLIV